jgi:hypothetical protein
MGRGAIVAKPVGGDLMLHKTSKMRGHHIHATDGVIGHVEDFLIDEETWATRYLIVDTSNWLGGRAVLISSAVIQSIDSPNKEIRVTLSREDIERGPSVNSVEIKLVETLPSVWIL